MFKKILKSRLTSYIISRLLIFYFILINNCCRLEITFIGKSKEVIVGKKPCVIAAWHSRFLVLIGLREYGSFTAVVSAHKDGGYLEALLKYYGHDTIRGSSRKGGVSAIRNILKLDKSKWRLVVTPDGPLGPRFKVKGSVFEIAKKLNIPVIPIVYSANKCIVLKTWDRFLLPIPFVSKIKLIFGEPLDNYSSEDLEKQMVQAMYDLDAQCNLRVDY